MKFDEGSEKLISGQRKAYLEYFLGGSNRVVSTVDELDFPKAGDVLPGPCASGWPA